MWIDFEKSTQLWLIQDLKKVQGFEPTTFRLPGDDSTTTAFKVLCYVKRLWLSKLFSIIYFSSSIMFQRRFLQDYQYSALLE